MVFGRFIDEARADDEVGLVIYDWLNKLVDIRNIVLAVSVILDGDIVIIFKGVFVASLDGSADAKIEA